jgi:hypothetical protein
MLSTQTLGACTFITKMVYMYKNVYSNTGTILSLITTTISGQNSDFIDGSFANIDISNTLTALSGTIPTLTITQISGSRSVYSDASFINVDIINSITAVAGSIGTLTNTNIIGNRSVFTDGSFINVDITNNILARSGSITTLTTTNAAGNRSVFTDSSYTNLDINNSINGNRCKLMDGSFTNITFTKLKYTSGISGQAIVSDSNGALSLATLTKASIGLDQVDNTTDASKPVSTALQTELDKKVSLSGATFRGLITTGASNIHFTDATAKIKYPTGTADHLLTSDAVGRLELTTAGLAITFGALYRGPNSFWYNMAGGLGPGGFVRSVLQITLGAGKYILNYRVGLYSDFNYSIKSTITLLNLDIDQLTTVNRIIASRYDYRFNDYNNNFGTKVIYHHCIPESSFNIELTTTTTYYINVQLFYDHVSGSPIPTIMAVDPATHASSYIYAIRYA